MKARFNSIVLLFLFVLTISCCKKYPYPPTFQLSENTPFAFIKTNVINSDSTVGQLVTTKLIEYLTYEQKGSFVETGSLENILSKYNTKELTSDIIKKIGNDYNVKSLVYSEVEFSDIEPDFQINFVNPSFHANVKLTAVLRLKIYEIKNGSLIFIKTIEKKTELSNVYLSKDHLFFNSKTFDESQYNLIDKLTWNITKDFRTIYKCK